MADLFESGKLSAPAQLTGKSWDIRVIEGDRQGSSAYYPAKVLEEGAPLFRAGTKIYMNHPTADENYNRPERNANDIIGYFTESGRYNPNTKSIHQKAHIFESHREWVKERAEAGVIGMSIRAQGELSEADGKKTLVRFKQIDSVDLVTEAGAGGKFEMLLESATPSSESGSVSESQEKEESVMDPKLEAALDALVESAKKNADEIAKLNARLDEADKKAVEEKKTAAAKAEDAKDGGVDDDEEDANGKKIVKKKAVTKESASAAQIADALLEAGLTAAARARVLKSVEGADLEGVQEAIKAEKEYEAEVLKESRTAGRFGHVADESARLSEAEELKKFAGIFS